MKERVIDVRNVPTTCTSNSTLVLVNELRMSESEGVDVLRVYFNADEIPEGLIALFLSKFNYAVEEVKALDKKSRLVVARRVK
ncbi:hypothetical protein TCELL_1036 [Thermogladius calderae 1633]|uniref:Uncharacterized protein n=1 Tax=Thermogladius calderae (strain DSM 22663 / VKM B-2946 / 1633) TaxID=1184251 RepID=I3TFC1_THEC1|nr:hypothetical protein [Thermogladius calderae]AFK51459.1 hypothetical protein TCELL_1036 [Thermogladius calderae 1633]